MRVAGWVLVHFVWQGLIVALVAALALHLCRRLSSSVRYAVACASLAAMLASVSITALVVSAATERGVARPHTSMRVEAGGRVDVLLPIDIPNSSQSPESSNTQRVEPPPAVDRFSVAGRCGIAFCAIGRWVVARSPAAPAGIVIDALRLAVGGTRHCSQNRTESRVPRCRVGRRRCAVRDWVSSSNCCSADCGHGAASSGTGRGHPRARAGTRSSP